MLLYDHKSRSEIRSVQRPVVCTGGTANGLSTRCRLAKYEISLQYERTGLRLSDHHHYKLAAPDLHAQFLRQLFTEIKLTDWDLTEILAHTYVSGLSL